MNMVMENRHADELLPSERQQEVLSAVLDLMVELGDGFSMATVAKRAKCSKETLYRWFGDRDGLLTATVQWQASKVVMPELDEQAATMATFKETLCSFATSWLTVLTGEVSIALNRLAVSHAGSGNSNLGQIVLKHGPFAMRERLTPIFELGREKGYMTLATDRAFGLFFGLVVRDVQIRALLGDELRLAKPQIAREAEMAVGRFFELCWSEGGQNE